MQRHFAGCITHVSESRGLLSAVLVLAAFFLACDRSASATTVAPTSRTPAFTSNPGTETNVGNEYAYPCVAKPKDPGGTLKYSLRQAPNGMVIENNGVVTWTPRPEDIGDHAVSIVVSESSASESVQSYCLTVTSPWTEKSKVRTLHYNDARGANRVCRVGLLMINTLPEPVSDNPKSPRLEFYTPEKLGHLFFHHRHGSNSFIREASYGRVALTGTVVGWLHAPKKGVGSADIVRDTEFYFGLAQEHMNFSEYDVFLVHALVEGEGSSGISVAWGHRNRVVAA